MQRGELLRTEDGFLRHEMSAEQIGVLDEGGFQGFPDDTLRGQFVGVNAAVEQRIVGEDHLAGDGRVAGRPAH